MNRRLRWLVPLIALGFALGLVGAVAWNVVGEPFGGEEAGEECVEPAVALHVVASPGVAEVVTDLGTRLGARAAGDERCIEIVTSERAPGDVLEALRQGWDTSADGPPPDVWIPDSSSWLELLRTDPEAASLVANESPSVARSPTVMAMPMPMAEAVGWPDGSFGWPEALALLRGDGWEAAGQDDWGPFLLGLPDPSNETAGLHAVMQWAAIVTEQPMPGLSADALSTEEARRGLLMLERGIERHGANTSELLDELRAADDTGDALGFVSAFPASERDVVRYNRGATDSDDGAQPPTVPLAAFYPEDGLGSDFPYAVLDAEWVDGGKRDVAARLLNVLLSSEGQQRFAEADLRSNQNVGGPAISEAEGVAPTDAPQGEPPEPEAAAAAYGTWRSLAQRGNVLSLIDVSGSMAEVIPETGQTLLETAAEAAVRGTQLFADESSFGLWAFSTDLDGASYRELVPIGRVDDELDGGVTRREAVIAALQGLEVENDTALYDTALAGYENLMTHYQEGLVNRLVLFTDGRNDYVDGQTLDELLPQLEELVDPERPAHIIAIAYGPRADVDSLEAIVEVTGGTVAQTDQPEDIERVFIEALLGGDGGP